VTARSGERPAAQGHIAGARARGRPLAGLLTRATGPQGPDLRWKMAARTGARSCDPAHLPAKMSGFFCPPALAAAGRSARAVRRLMGQIFYAPLCALVMQPTDRALAVRQGPRAKH